ncbi:hypothetical protein BP6252_09451 [Coleophoma cylindrospora]|uniref:AB hydrolase-1 domain-containing protein n=1 Tax=Coleophoma cylindrospora TaxID=1849047 RepID=A0A3D8R1Y2_9HELO|nr:hypothetical protein BP6252_09451 [Coleophoma cylindrospora]
MSAPQPTVVIVPGAWQLPAGFDLILAQLKEANIPAEFVPLPSVGGTELPLTGLPEDVAAVRSTLTRLADEGKDMVLLGHSYGGVVVSCAVEGFDAASRAKEGKTGGVILTVFMSAFMLPKGQSLLGVLGGAPLPWMNVEGDRVSGVAAMMPQVAFNDIPEEKMAEYGAQMSHTSALVFATPSTYEPWANGLPCTYIFLTDDNALPYPIQQQMASQIGPDAKTWSLKAGHLPHLSMPSELAKTIGEISEYAVSKKA